MEFMQLFGFAFGLLQKIELGHIYSRSIWFWDIYIPIVLKRHNTRKKFIKIPFMSTLFMTKNKRSQLETEQETFTTSQKNYIKVW